MMSFHIYNNEYGKQNIFLKKEEIKHSNQFKAKQRLFHVK